MRREEKSDRLRRRHEIMGFLVLCTLILPLLLVVRWFWLNIKQSEKRLPSSGSRAQSLSSAWLRSFTIPIECHKHLDQHIVSNGRVPDLGERMGKVDKLKKLIDQLCAERGISPELAYGLILHESHGDVWSVDFKTKLGQVPVTQAHVGLGQLSQDFLPEAMRVDPARLRAADAWQRATLDRIARKQWPPTAAERVLLSKWAALDLRFNARWNLEKTLDYVKQNLEITGNETLAILAHLRGTRYPLWWVARYRFDHERVPYNEADRIRLHRTTAPYVKSEGIDLFDLIVDTGAEGSRYRSDRKAQVYCFSILAWSELYARHRKTLRPPRFNGAAF
ncbi:MAG: hypothetical protein WCT32_02835 [Patescibacteria group bacterium]